MASTEDVVKVRKGQRASPPRSHEPSEPNKKGGGAAIGGIEEGLASAAELNVVALVRNRGNGLPVN